MDSAKARPTAPRSPPQVMTWDPFNEKQKKLTKEKSLKNSEFKSNYIMYMLNIVKLNEICSKVVQVLPCSRPQVSNALRPTLQF